MFFLNIKKDSEVKVKYFATTPWTLCSIINILHVKKYRRAKSMLGHVQPQGYQIRKLFIMLIQTKFREIQEYIFPHGFSGHKEF